MATNQVVPKTGRLLRNVDTGEVYPYRKIEEAHPPKVEFLHVTMPSGEVVRAMCLNVEGGYSVYFQGLVH
jgi:hypothetical protein